MIRSEMVFFNPIILGANMGQDRESVNGIIFSTDRSEVLLIKRRDVPVWVLPGGGIERGETGIAAVRREIEEETGYQVTVTRKVATYTPICRLALLTHFYECTIFAGKPTLGDETSALEFFPLNRLPSRLTPPYPDWIADAIPFSKQEIKKKITQVTYAALLKHAIFHPLLVGRFLYSRRQK